MNFRRAIRHTQCSSIGTIDWFHRPADEEIVNPMLKSFRIHAKRLVNNVDGSVDVRVGVREADYEGRSEDSAKDQFLQEQRAKGL